MTEYTSHTVHNKPFLIVPLMSAHVYVGPCILNYFKVKRYKMSSDGMTVKGKVHFGTFISDIM